MSYLLYSTRNCNDDSSMNDKILLYASDKRDQFLKSVTKYMIDIHRSYIKNRNPKSNKYMYSDHYQTMEDQIRDKMDYAENGIEYRFEKPTEDIFIQYHKNDTGETVQYDNNSNYVTSNDTTSELLPEICDNKWSNIQNEINREKANTSVRLVQTSTHPHIRCKSAKCQTMPVLYTITPRYIPGSAYSLPPIVLKRAQKSTSYSDLIHELHIKGNHHPLWKRYVKIVT
jgi:hypothetical protein